MVYNRSDPKQISSRYGGKPILDTDSAPPESIPWLLVAVLKMSNVSPEASSQHTVSANTHMTAREVAFAESIYSHRKEQSRAKEIGHLNASMVFAVPERRHFQYPTVIIARTLEFLCKD